MVSYFYGFETLNNMKEQIKIALWNKVKSTYPSGTSKHTNALLEEDFDSFIDDVVKICTIPAVVGQREQLVCDCMPDPTCRVEKNKVLCNGCNKERK
jgi:hypothetical protein